MPCSNPTDKQMGSTHFGDTVPAQAGRVAPPDMTIDRGRDGCAKAGARI